MLKSRKTIALPDEIWKVLKEESKRRDLPANWLIADACRRIYLEGDK